MDQILPPKSNPPMPQIPRPSPLPRLELMYQEIGEDEPTVRMRIPTHLLHESRGPNYGLMGAIVLCLAFWGSIAYLIFR